MSFEAIAYAKSLDLGPLDNAQTHLLLRSIAENTFNDTFVCRLSREQLAYECGRVSERTVRRHIADMIEGRVLLRRENYAPGGGRTTDDLRIVGFKKWYLANHRKSRQSKADKLSGMGGGANRTICPGHTGQQVSGPPGQQVSGIYKDSLTTGTSEEARERADDFGFQGKAARDLLRQMLGDQVYVAWFQGMAFALGEGGRVEARAANDFKAKWVAQNFERPLLDACRKVNPAVTSVVVVAAGRAERPAPAAEVLP